MSSSEAQHPRRKRRWKWLLAALIALLAGYIGGWYYLSTQVQSEFDRALADLNRDGVIAQCTNRGVGGFPFSVSLDCDTLNYEDAGKQTYATTGALRSRAEIMDPMLALIELDGPLRVQAPSLIPIWLDWKRLAGDVRFGFPTPKRVFLEGEGLAAQSDPEDESNPVELFKLERVSGRLAPTGTDIDAFGTFNNLQISPSAVGGRDIPPLSGQGEAAIVNGLRMIAERANSFRGQSVRIKSLELSSGEARVSLNGPLAVDTAGLIDAELTLTVSNPEALSVALQQAVPEHADEIASGLAGFALLSDELRLPLKITKGNAMLGPIVLGNLPPLN